jgi:hypothetical protein
MRKFKILYILILCIGIASCEKLIEPKPDDSLTDEQLKADPIFAEGLLMQAYSTLPNEYTFDTDVATDDAVTNDNSVYRNMATGSWTSTNNPISKWTVAYQNISYINHFLNIYQEVEWSTDPNATAAKNTRRNALHKNRLKGESYGLRAWYEWMLLQYHGGMGEDGTLYGFPIVDTYITQNDDWKIPRSTYDKCVTRILQDLDTAIKYLPPTFKVIADADSNETYGSRFLNRINGYAAQALKARVALLAASPSFSSSSGVTWAQAATFAGPLMKKLRPGFLSYANGVVFYLERTNNEIIWNRAEVVKRTWEQNNFPPSLWGSGRTNPSQNLVDAFGMKNGYPITDAASTYNSATPYANRDPRLAKYVVYNTATLKSTVINSHVGAPKDGINVLLTSTRTGYYLKKFMNEGVKLDAPAANQGHTYTLTRVTELLLNYAEAANEAWGPTGDPNGYGFTAKSLIGDLRKRGGITQPDAYLASVSDQATMRNLIRNERRIELCFEGFRFWDIRRWNDVTTMQAPVKAAYITNNSGTFSYVYSPIEERKYASDMIYGPIPYNETLKYNLVQNKGW